MNMTVLLLEGTLYLVCCAVVGFFLSVVLGRWFDSLYDKKHFFKEENKYEEDDKGRTVS